MTSNKIQEIQKFKENKNRLLGRLLNRSYRYMSEVAVGFLKSKGYQDVRVGHIIALVHIDFEGISLNNLALNAGITKQGMSKIVKELMDAEYVITEKSLTDARSFKVLLTDKGYDALSMWKECTQHVDKEFTKIVGSERLEQVKDILSVLVNHYEALPGHDLEEQLFSTILYDK